jgi:hypothetical protein
MQLQGMQQQQAQQAAMAPIQQQLGQQQVQEGQQNQAARQALNHAYSGAMTKDADGNPTIDPNKLASGLANGPAAYQTPQVMKGITDFQTSRIELQSKSAALQQTQADMLGSAASAIKAANYDPTLAHSMLDSLPQTPQLQQIRQQIDNPLALKQVVDSALLNSPAQQKMQNEQTVAKLRSNTPETQEMNSWITTANAGKNPGDPGYKTPADYQQFKVDQGVQADIQKQTSPAVIAAAAQKAGAEESARMPGEMALAAQRQSLSQGDPKAAARLLVNGDATLSELKTRGATPQFIEQALQSAHQMTGGQYNAQQADAQFQVAKSPAQVAFFGSAQSLTNKGGTLDQLQTAGKQIPGGLIPAFNSLADWEKAATGSGPIAKYASIALGVADDYAKVMGGGVGTDASRLQTLKLVGANQSPDQRTQAIQGIHGAVQSQISGRIGANPILGRMYGGQQGGAAQPTTRSAAPSGATHIAPGSDGHNHYTNNQGQDLGVAP